MYNFISKEDFKNYLKEELLTLNGAKEILGITKDEMERMEQLREIEAIDMGNQMKVYLKSDILYQKSKMHH